MSTSTILPPSSPVAEHAPLRLRLSPPGGDRPLNGAWWPRSRDLTAEVTDLVEHFPALDDRRARISRIVYSPPDWDGGTRRIPVAGGTIRAGAYPRDDTHVLLLVLSTGAMLRLLVVPPGTAPDHAALATALATAADNRRDAADVLEAAAGPGVGPDEDADGRSGPRSGTIAGGERVGEDPWTDGGGAWWDPHPTPPSQRHRA
jgi:hypothetical protein